MAFARYFFGLIAIGFSSVAFAQCPYGMPNNPGCVPPDAWPQNQGEGGSARQPYWVYTWGAIAMDPSVVGVATGLDTKRQAEKAAIKDCRDGGGRGCKVVISYNHQCAAFAAGDRWSQAARGPDIEEVKIRAIENCQKSSGNEDCKIIYSNCTEPYIVR